MSMKKIEEARGQVTALKRRRSEVEGQGRSRAEVRLHVEDLVRGWEAEARDQHDLHLHLISTGQSLPLLSPDKLGQAFVLLLGADQVAKALLTNLDTVPEGFQAAEREELIRSIESELEEVERQEEALIVAAEERGDRVIRRADARPEIVLGRREPAPAVLPRSPHYQYRGDAPAKRRRFAVAPMFPGE